MPEVSWRPAPGTIPPGPGVYRFRDASSRVIYVGKAKSLRSRLSSYFQDAQNLHPRTRQMVALAADVDWTVVGTEVEALQLEYSQIKAFDPRFNVRYRDDKSYPSLAVTLDEPFPRASVVRGPRRQGPRYFGPYAHAWAIRETLDLLLRVFPIRTCSAGVFKRAGQVGRPCLLGYIGKCSAPCVGRVDEQAHREIAEQLCEFLSGRPERMVLRLEAEMARAAEAEQYERAARLRDDIAALRRVLEKQTVVLADATDADVVGIARDELEAAVYVFYVRGGRVRGQRGWVVDLVEDLAVDGIVEQFLTQVYGEPDPGAAPSPGHAPGRPGPDAPRARRPAPGVDPELPREVLVPVLPTDAAAVTDWLTGLRGGRVELRVPRRGDKRALLETVTRNAEQAFALHKLRRASDLTARSRALAEVAEVLGLPEAPLRIECFDVSHVQGSDVVASMVVFEDGLARKSEYRRFALREVDAGDDTRWMHEVVSRRFSRYLAETTAGAAADVEGGPARPARFAYPPQLVVVDGGAPQVGAACAALGELGIGSVSVCGLAKRLEEVWLPGAADPVILPRTSEALYLLQRVRDEAHRFAITYHRQKRSRSMLSSVLDDVPGLGAARRQALLSHFRSVARMRQADLAALQEVPGVGRATAVAVYLALHGADRPAPAVDAATGEVLAP